MPLGVKAVALEERIPPPTPRRYRPDLVPVSSKLATDTQQVKVGGHRGHTNPRGCELSSSPFLYLLPPGSVKDQPVLGNKALPARGVAARQRERMDAPRRADPSQRK